MNSLSQMVKVKLREGKELEIKHMVSTSFWTADGKPISTEQFLQNLFGDIPNFFKSESELRKIWSSPATRKKLLYMLESAGYGREELENLQKLINAENSDLFDVLEYVAYQTQPISREQRVAHAQMKIFERLDNKQKEFLEFVLTQYIHSGVDELSEGKLPKLLVLKYKTIPDAQQELGDVDTIRNTFLEFQKHLYDDEAA